MVVFICDIMQVYTHTTLDNKLSKYKDAISCTQKSIFMDHDYVINNSHLALCSCEDKGG